VLFPRPAWTAAAAGSFSLAAAARADVDTVLLSASDNAVYANANLANIGTAAEREAAARRIADAAAAALGALAAPAAASALGPALDAHALYARAASNFLLHFFRGDDRRTLEASCGLPPQEQEALTKRCRVLLRALAAALAARLCVAGVVDLGSGNLAALSEQVRQRGSPRSARGESWELGAGSWERLRAI
jgi:hypothetical protein